MSWKRFIISLRFSPFQDKAERASAEGGVYVELDIVYLRQASAYVVDRLIFKNQYTIAPGAVLVQVYILTDGLDSIFYLKVFAGLQCCPFSGVCDLYFYPRRALRKRRCRMR